MASASDAGLTPEQIARDILTKVKTVSLIENRSACSVIFDCTLIDDRHVCMKVSFVHTKTGQYVNYDGIKKFTTTREEAEGIRERQHRMHNELKGYNQPEFILDAFGSCTLTPHEFQTYFEVKPGQPDHLNPNARDLDLIVQTAQKYSLSIHILFMELLTSVHGYNKLDDVAVRIRNTPYIVAAILAVGIVTGVISQDMHADNVQIPKDGDVTGLKLIDWDRSISIYSSPDDVTKEEGWIDLLAKTNPDSFLSACNYFTDATGLKNLAQRIRTTPSLWRQLQSQIKEELKAIFNIYYRDLSERISNYRSLSVEHKIYNIFDLLTFIGFMDCLLKGARTCSTTMQFSPFLYNLFNTEGIKIITHENSDLGDLVKLRQTYLESLKFLPDSVPSKLKRGKHEANLERVEEVLDAISRILDRFLLPRETAGRGGRPRYLKRTRHNTIKKQHRNKNNRKSIKRIYRRSKIRNRNTRN
jgi:hypothetical protein